MFRSKGLSLVNRIVEAHGGPVRIESAPGAGIRVFLQFPKTADGKMEKRK